MASKFLVAAALIQFVSADCSVLPQSMNGPSHPSGCPGAVWSNGSPSQSYCENTSGQYPWWETCCYWDSTQGCLSLDSVVCPTGYTPSTRDVTDGSDGQAGRELVNIATIEACGSACDTAAFLCEAFEYKPADQRCTLKAHGEYSIIGTQSSAWKTCLGVTNGWSPGIDGSICNEYTCNTLEQRVCCCDYCQNPCTQFASPFSAYIECAGCDAVSAAVCVPGAPGFGVPGCDGVAYSGLENDACGVCDGDGSSCAGCDGVPNSGAVNDVCGVCGGDGSSCAGCDGVPNSGIVKDACGVCGGDGTSCVGGCYEVVPGSTGKDCGYACVKDNFAGTFRYCSNGYSFPRDTSVSESECVELCNQEPGCNYYSMYNSDICNLWIIPAGTCTLTTAGNPSARTYVRGQCAGASIKITPVGNTLNLAEVTAFDADGGVIPAISATLSASLDALLYPDSNCIDGVTDQGFCHGASDGDFLTIQYPYIPASIVVHNRNECCADRIEGAEIEAFDKNGALIWESTFPMQAQATYDFHIDR